MRQRIPIPDRFWSKVEKTDGCWLWTGAQNGAGYGMINDGRKQRRAHRIAYELLVGPIPEGLQLDHLCRVRHCVNPAHLEPVTHAVNVRRGDSGRHHADKTHCVNGHEFTPENTIRRSNGCRDCRACGRIRNMAQRRKLFYEKVAAAFGWPEAV